MNFGVNPENYRIISMATICETVFDFHKARVSFVKVYEFWRKKNEGKLRFA